LEDEGGEDFLEDDLDVWHKDLSLGDDFDTASEVLSGVFNATHSNKFEEPDGFKKLYGTLLDSLQGAWSFFLIYLRTT
jgi:hypothetical protein